MSRKPTCPVCGKKFWCDYPHLWAYKRENKFICSWGCLRKYDGKEAKTEVYTKTKKDGQPAKKPGPKPKAEEPTVELVYDPSIEDEYRREQAEKAERTERGRRIAEGLDRADRIRQETINGADPLPIAALYSRTIDGARFKKIDGGMELTSAEWRIRLTAYEWFKLTEEILVAIRQLDAARPGPLD